MNVVFLFLSFNGIGNDRGMYGDLVCEYAQRGYNVYVIAPSKNKREFIEDATNIKIKWVNSLSLLGVGFITKAIANILLPYVFLKASKGFLPKDVNLIISPTPPITLTGVVEKIKKQYKARFYLILRDIFPQNAVDLGLIGHNSLIYKYFRRKEKRLYELADAIGCMSQGNIDYILQHNPKIAPQKVEILPNWVDVKKTLINTNSDFLRNHNLEGKFIAIFGGNLGIAQNPSNIIDLAELYKDNNEIVFLIIGKGIFKKKIENMIKTRNLSNVIMFDYIPRDKYEPLARSCNVGLVSLNGNFTIPNIPSRALGYWQASLPIFAIIDKNTDFGLNVLDKHKGGVWCIAGDLKQYKEKFDLLYKNYELAKKMGDNGHQALFKEYNVESIVDIISSHD